MIDLITWIFKAIYNIIIVIVGVLFFLACFTYECIHPSPKIDFRKEMESNIGKETNILGTVYKIDSVHSNGNGYWLVSKDRKIYAMKDFVVVTK